MMYVRWTDTFDSNGVASVTMHESSGNPGISDRKETLTLDMVKRDLSIYHRSLQYTNRLGIFDASGLYVGINLRGWYEVRARMHPDAFLSVHMADEWIQQKKMYVSKGYRVSKLEKEYDSPHEMWVKLSGDGTVEHLSRTPCDGSTKCDLTWWGVSAPETSNDMVVGLLPRLLTQTVMVYESIGFVYAHIQPCKGVRTQEFVKRQMTQYVETMSRRSRHSNAASKSSKSSKKRVETEEERAKRVEANKKLMESITQKAVPVRATNDSAKSTSPTGGDKPQEESEHARKILEREAAESKERAAAERERQEKILAERKARANATEKPFSVRGPSHKAKVPSDAEAVPDALRRAKDASKKATDLDAIAKHVEGLKLAEKERIAAEEAKLEMRRLAKEIGGS